MLKTLSYSELVYWMGFFSVEPLPQVRADLQAAYSTFALVNANRPRDKSVPFSTFFGVFDFWKERSTKKQTPAQLYQTAVLINAMIGGKDDS